MKQYFYRYTAPHIAIYTANRAHKWIHRSILILGTYYEGIRRYIHRPTTSWRH